MSQFDTLTNIFLEKLQNKLEKEKCNKIITEKRIMPLITNILQQYNLYIYTFFASYILIIILLIIIIYMLKKR